MTAHLDFHLSKACLLWLTETEPQRERLPGKDGCSTLHSCEKKLPAEAGGHFCRFGGELVEMWFEALIGKEKWLFF